VAWKQHLQLSALAEKVEIASGQLKGIDASVLAGDARVVSEISKSLLELETTAVRHAERLGSLDTDVRRALGHVVVGESQPDLVVAVRESVNRWLPSSPPSGLPEDSEEIRAELATLESSTATGHGNAFRSQLALLAWWADVVDLHHASSETLSRAPSQYEWAQSLRVSTPGVAPDWAFGVVAAAERKVMVQLATFAAARPISTIEELDASVEMIDRVVRDLGAEAPKLLLDERQRLESSRAAMVERGILEALSRLKQERAEALRSSGSDQIRLQILAGFDGQLIGLLTSMGSVSSEYRKEVEGLSQAWQAETVALDRTIRDRQYSRYQAWANSRIDTFVEKANPHAEGLNNTNEILATMTLYLTPIDTSLLDPPIASKFNTVWDDWKDTLDGSQQRSLYKSLGESTKKRLGDV
jgi:hypothetical protein